jgi:hypothetical protein
LYIQDPLDIQVKLMMDEYAGQEGFSKIWQANIHLASDDIIKMSSFLASSRCLSSGPPYCRSGFASGL